MPSERGLIFSSPRIPESHRVVPTRTCQRPAIRTERYAPDTARMTREEVQFCTGMGIVYPYTNTACHRESIAIRGIRYLSSYLTFAEAGFGTFGQIPFGIILGGGVWYKQKRYKREREYGKSHCSHRSDPLCGWKCVGEASCLDYREKDLPPTVGVLVVVQLIGRADGR
jgi:hypothetical protein